ncbi:MAG: type VI secretion system contractile sheath protein TssC [Muribaculaceae bacterium]|nr:type VI secretion system contractile sheath protein TssC [Muribaculaceae bacterium]
MATEGKAIDQPQQEELQARQAAPQLSTEELLESGLDSLKKFGGFQIVKGLIKGAANLDPKEAVVKKLFLKDADYEEERNSVKKSLDIWIDLLENGKEAGAEKLMEVSEQKAKKAEKNLSKNLKKVLEEIRQLEMAYRGVDAFFANAGQGKVDCLTIMNVEKEALSDYDSLSTKKVRDELEKYYDRLNLKRNYSLMVAPGYLGDSDTVRTWAKTAYRNKVLLITDFKDSLKYDMLKQELDKANLQDQDVELANVVMTCNYLLGRKKSKTAKEDDDFYIPASSALAGRMTNTDEVVISQGIAGKKYGTLENVKGVRMDMRKSEIASIIDEGVVPVVEEDGRVMAFSNRSLYNGATIGLQEYPIVRVFDWMAKVFQNFFNDEAFRVFDGKVRDELSQALHGFLSDYKGPGGLIESYSLKGIEQNPVTKDINIKVELKPFFAAKNFLIELTGHNGTAGVDWNQNVQNKE